MSRAIIINCLAKYEIIMLMLLVVILFKLLLCSGKVVSKVDTKSNKSVLTTYPMMYLFCSLERLVKTVAANVVFFCSWDEYSLQT